jgi:phosphatidylinositol alpha-1,6-mannosyltransferase
MNGDPRTLLLLTTDFPPATGGIQTLTWEVYGRLTDVMRLAVAPTCAAPAAAEAAWPLRRARHGCAGGWGALAYLHEAAAMLARAAAPPCLLHCNHIQAAMAARWLRQRYGLRYVVWVHGEELTRHRWPRLAGACLRGAAAVVANSRFTAERARDLMGRGGPEVRIVPLGAPAEWLAAPVGAREGGRVPVVLTVARLLRRDRYKGVDTALRAMAELKSRGLEAHYNIAGDGDDRAPLEALARELELTDRVTFLGRVPDAGLRALYDEADIFLLCSREVLETRGLGFEGFGIALVEAAARGLPAVAGRSGGIVDVVADGETGILVDPTSAAAVAGGLARLLSDGELRRRLGAQARRRAQNEFRWDITAARTRALHEEWVRR